MRKRNIVYVVLGVVLIAVVAVAVVLANKKEPPVMGIKVQSVPVEKGCKIICEVYNSSEEIMHFDSYKIAKGFIRNTQMEDVELITQSEYVELKPGESFYTEFVFEDFGAGYYTVEVTAECLEGTKGTMIIQVEIK